MKNKLPTILLSLIALGVVSFLVWFLFNGNIAMLDTKGLIASQQRDLLLFTTGLMLLVALPVFVLTFFIAWKYREGNKKAKYTPNWDSHKLIEVLWWGIPGAIILVLAIVTWVSSHTLDPYRAIESDKKPLTIQVVALQWKWLFIYPEQKIASVNLVQFPEDTPINFEITSDAPMNSFWIPQLGGQVYAMSGMKTQLHLMADEPGSYNGSSGNISGEGFAGMDFVAKASTDAEFKQWIKDVRASKDILNKETYYTLSQPSKDNPSTLYAVVDHKLYDTIIMKYMMPSTSGETANSESAKETEHNHANH